MDTCRVDERMDWIKEQQTSDHISTPGGVHINLDVSQNETSVRQESYGSTERGIQAAMGKHTEIHDKVMEFRDTLSEANVEPKELLSDVKKALGWLNEMVSKKQTCFETLLKISQLEKQYQESCTNVDHKALKLKKHGGFSATPQSSNDVRDFAKSLKSCSTAVNKQWAWLSDLQRCSQIHLYNAANYHQFFHDVEHSQEGLESLIIWFSRILKQQGETQTLTLVEEDLKNILLTLLDHQDKVDELFCNVSSIVPLRWRCELPNKEVQVTALADYRDAELSIKDGSVYTLVDNSDSSYWMVRDISGQEIQAPAAIFLIPPVDRDAVDSLQILRGLLMSVWKLAVKVFRIMIIPSMTVRMQDTPVQKITCVSRDQRDVILNHLHDMVDKLQPEQVAAEPYSQFADVLQDLYRTVHDQHNKPQSGNHNPEEVEQEWNEVGEVIRKFEDLQLYAECYEDSLNDTSESIRHTLSDEDEGQLRYVTKAYVNKMKPIEIDHIVPVEIEHVPAEEVTMYIHEKRQSPDEPQEVITCEVAEKIVFERLIETEIVEDIFSHQTVNETRKFSITGVMDPSAGDEMISMFEAANKGILDQRNGVYRNPVTGEVIPIGQAMNCGLIRMEMVDSSTVVEDEGRSVQRREVVKDVATGVQQTTKIETVPVTESYKIASIRDPKTNTDVTPSQALKMGILNSDELMYVNPLTNESLTLEQACEQGLVDLVVLDESAEEELGENAECLIEASTDVVTKNYAVSSVIDPRTKYEISLKQAKLFGIIDEKQGLYRNPHTGDELALHEAIERGVVKCEPVEGDEETEVLASNILPIRVQQCKEQRYYVPVVAEQCDPSEAAMLALLDELDGSMTGVRESNTNEDLTLSEAGKNGVIKFDALEYLDSNGESFLLQEAAALSFVDSDTLKSILSAYENKSLDGLIEDGVIDPVNGLFRTANGNMIPLSEAIDNGFLDPNSVFLYDPKSGKPVSLAHAIDSGLFNPATGCFVDKDTGKEMTIEDAISQGFIEPKVQAEKLCQQAAMLATLMPHCDEELHSINVPDSDEKLTIKDAVLAGALDVSIMQLLNPATGVSVPLHETQEKGLIDPKALKEIYQALANSSLANAIDGDNIDPKKGTYRHSENGDEMSIAQSIEEGLLDPHTLFFVDETCHQVTSLAAFIAKGAFDPKRGCFVDPKDGRKLNIQQAIDAGLINPDINPAEFVEEKFKLKDLFSDGIVSRDSGFVTPDGENMSLAEALEKDYVTPVSVVKIDPKTGLVVLADNSGLVSALKNVNKDLDWLSDLENKMATQPPAQDDVDVIQNMLAENEKLLDILNKKDKDVCLDVGDAAQVVDDNKNKEREAEDEKQFQRLRYNTSDLKLRHDAAKHQLEERQKRLKDMGENLHEFYGDADKLTEWLQGAGKKLADMRNMAEDIDNIGEYATQFKTFAEETSAQEVKLAKLVEDGEQCKEDAKEYDAMKDKFTESLANPVETCKKEPLNNVDSTIDCVQGNFKNLMAECTDLMAGLTEMAKVNQEYKKLSQKLETAVPVTEKELEELVARPVSADSEALEDELAKLRDIKGNVADEAIQVEDLKKIGDELRQKLEQQGATQQAANIDQFVKDLDNRLIKMQTDLNSKENDLNATLLESQDASNNLENMLTWVAQVEGLVESMAPVSLDNNILNQQLREHKLLQSDLQTQLNNLPAVAEQVKDLTGANEKVDELNERLQHLGDKLKSRGSDLDENVEKLADLQKAVDSVESWIASAVESLKSAGAMPGSATLKDKIIELHAQKAEKQPVMDELKAIARDLINSPKTGEKNHLREELADIQGKWNDVTEMLVEIISSEAGHDMDELLKYLDKAEAKLHDAEPVNIDPETLALQLRDHKALDEELLTKTDEMREVIKQCNTLLRETTSEDSENMKNKLEHIRGQADNVCKLSADRLRVLEEVMPLVSSFSETHSDLSTWLQEIEAEIQAQEMPAKTADEIKKQVDQVKQNLRFIDDHKPLVDDLGNTGKELISLCSGEECETIKSSLYDINTQYDDVRNNIRNKINELEEAYRAATTEVSDTVDGLLEELHLLNDQIQCAEPIAASTDKIHDQITDNQNLLDDLSNRQEAIAEARDAADRLTETLQDDDKVDVEDLLGKVRELEELNKSISDVSCERGKALNEALEASQRFWSIYNDLMAALHDVGDNLSSLDQPHVESSAVQDQQKELKVIEDEFKQTNPKLTDCQEAGSQLAAICGEPGQVEVEKHIEDVQSTWDEIEEGIHDRQEDLGEALERAKRFEQTMKDILSWLPKQEEKLKKLPPAATNTRALRIQIEELKVIKLQVHPHCVEVESLNQQATELKNLSPVGAEGLATQADEVTDRWNHLVEGISDREHKLQQNLVRLGELDHALDDSIGFLQQLEQDLTEMDSIYGDPRFIETHLKKIKMMQHDLKNYEPIVTSLNDTVKDMVSAEGDQNSKVSPLIEKQDEMNGLWNSVDVLARDRKNRLEDILREAKSFMGEVEDLLYWLNDYRSKLKTAQPLGALPETANRQFGRFMRCENLEDGYKALGAKEDEVKTILLNGEDMLGRCRPLDAIQLRESLGKLRCKWLDARKKADAKKKKLEDHLRNVTQFHDTMRAFTEWLVDAENILGTFRYPSKLVDTCAQQITEHRKFREVIEKHQSKMDHLDKTGTYLKYFGRKQDTVFIKSQLVSIKLRWKKLVRKTDERGRLLQQAHKEDKRFYTSWKDLMDWLDGAEKKLATLTQSQSSPAKVKQCMDDIKHFEHQLSSKHPKYYSTSRLGRNLKDRCTKNDPEKDILQTMVDDLKNKWCVVRSLVSQRQNKLEESLLMSGRFADALQSFLEWLGKAEESLSEDLPILGDLDTVLMLIEQNKQFEQELENRESMVATMKASANNNDPKMAEQLEELTERWDNVKRLSSIRGNRLQDAQKLGEQFQEVVNTMRDWLPQAEAELKFRPLPEDELAIVQLIERHENFEEQMNAQRPNMDKIKELGEEILHNCHPNALRFVKYYLTITQTRWEQAQTRSKNRSKRLQEALKGIRGNAALLEELLAWLSEAQALLAQKERDPIPEDLAVVEALVKEHADLHDDLTNKNQDMEQITRTPTLREQQRRYTGRRSSYNRDVDNPRVHTLQTRWRTVWRMSVERKKTLQDLLDHMMELESFKNFDFDLWRQRYMKWIKTKKLRITDFFRRQDKEGRGILTRQQFVDGMMSCGFPTNRTELNAVFDIFDRDGSGEIDYREFVEALRPRTKKPKRPLTDGEMIHDEIERQVSQCSCRSQFKVSKVGEGKYRFGESQKLVLVRFLNSSVMVRVGGGWETLQKFLEGHDPCQAKGRTNTELREKFILPKGAAQSRASFTRRKASADTKSTRSASSASSTGSAGKTSDAGYDSMHSGSVNGSRRFLQRNPLLHSTHLSGSYDCLKSRLATPPRGKNLARSMTNLSVGHCSQLGGANGFSSPLRKDSMTSSANSLSSSSSREKTRSPSKRTPSSKKKC